MSKSALKRCGYQDWSFKRACVKKNKTTSTNRNPIPRTQKNKNQISVVNHFVPGLFEKIKSVYGQYETAARGALTYGSDRDVQTRPPK